MGGWKTLDMQKSAFNEDLNHKDISHTVRPPPFWFSGHLVTNNRAIWWYTNKCVYLLREHIKLYLFSLEITFQLRPLHHKYKTLKGYNLLLTRGIAFLFETILTTYHGLRFARSLSYWYGGIKYVPPQMFTENENGVVPCPKTQTLLCTGFMWLQLPCRLCFYYVVCFHLQLFTCSLAKWIHNLASLITVNLQCQFK